MIVACNCILKTFLSIKEIEQGKIAEKNQYKQFSWNIAFIVRKCYNRRPYCIFNNKTLLSIQFAWRKINLKYFEIEVNFIASAIFWNTSCWKY